MRRLAALALLLIAAPASAQVVVPPATPERDRGWFTFGIGTGGPEELVGSLTANVGRERFLQAGFHSSTNLFGTIGVNAVHVGAGLSRVSRWDRTAISAGPAVVWGQRRLDEAPWRDGFATAGVVVNGQAMFTPIPELGLGLNAFVNVNPVQSSYGVTLSFVFEGNK